jgi:hypothetical protein
MRLPVGRRRLVGPRLGGQSRPGPGRWAADRMLLVFGDVRADGRDLPHLGAHHWQCIRQSVGEYSLALWAGGGATGDNLVNLIGGEELTGLSDVARLGAAGSATWWFRRTGWRTRWIGGGRLGGVTGVLLNLRFQIPQTVE